MHIPLWICSPGQAAHRIKDFAPHLIGPSGRGFLPEFAACADNRIENGKVFGPGRANPPAIV